MVWRVCFGFYSSFLCLYYLKTRLLSGLLIRKNKRFFFCLLFLNLHFLLCFRSGPRDQSRSPLPQGEGSSRSEGCWRWGTEMRLWTWGPEEHGFPFHPWYCILCEASYNLRALARPGWKGPERRASPASQAAPLLSKSCSISICLFWSLYPIHAQFLLALLKNMAYVGSPLSHCCPPNPHYHLHSPGFEK